jgi:D-xylose transport system substrate-binding protein
MFRLNRLFTLISIFMITAMLLAACAPAAPAPTQAPAEPPKATEAPAPVETAAPAPTEAPVVVPTEAPAPAETGPIKIGLFLPDKKTARYETKDRPFFEAKLKEICPDCELISDISDSDPVAQQNAVEQAITNGVKAIAIMAVDTKAAAVIADNAKAAGIPVIAYSRLLENSDGVTVNIAFALADIGRAQAKSLVEALDKKGIANPQIVMVNGSATDSNMPPIRDGAMEVFQPLIDAGKLTIVQSVDTPDWDPSKAQSEMEQILTATGGKVDGVYVMNDGMASGVAAAIIAAGISPVPPITGLDCELAAIQRILVGQQYSSVYMPISTMAEQAAVIAYALATTGKIPDGMASGTINNGAIDVPSVSIPVVNVDSTNIQSNIIDTGFWTYEDICTPEFMDACTAAGLK